MSGELTPDRNSLRASHEDREQAVEQLRIAAGDGRLTAEELDERLERALTARTYADLDALLADLPSGPGATPVLAAAETKDLVQLRSRGGNINRVGPWAVPRRLEAEVRGGNVVLDFTRAVITQPALDLAVAISGGNLRLIVPPGVAVDVDSLDMRGGNIRQRVHHEPGTPVRLMVNLSGHIRGGNVVIRPPGPPPGQGFWARLFARLFGHRTVR